MSEEYPTFADGRYQIESRLGDGGMAAVFPSLGYTIARLQSY